MTSQQSMENLVTQVHSNLSEEDIINKNGMNSVDTIIGENNSNRTNRTRVLTPQEISKTFRIMAYRKSERQVRGRYRRQSYTRIFWIMMFMLLYLSLIGAGVGGLLSKLIYS